MKINGQTLDEPSKEVLVIPKGSMKAIFEISMVTDYTEFDALCPEPKIPTMIKPGSAEPIEMPEEPKYQEERRKWSELKYNYMILKSLETSPGLEWDEADIAKPATYELWRKELEESHFSDAEILKIIQTVVNVNGLNTERIEEATASFLVEQEALKKESLQSQNTEQGVT